MTGFTCQNETLRSKGREELDRVGHNLWKICLTDSIKKSLLLEKPMRRGSCRAKELITVQNCEIMVS